MIAFSISAPTPWPTRSALIPRFIQLMPRIGVYQTAARPGQEFRKRSQAWTRMTPICGQVIVCVRRPAT
jgi:hypothetical protein